MNLILVQVCEREHAKEQQKAEDMYWAELNAQERVAKELK